MKKNNFFGKIFVLLVLCIILAGCDDKNGGMGNGNELAHFPFPQRSASLATYQNRPMLPSNMMAAERDMIDLFVSILNQNLIFDSRMPLNPQEFRIVFQHHTNSIRTQALEDHITVSESMGYGMLLLVYMAGSEERLTEAGHTWRFGAASLKDYYDGMLRTVLAFQSPLIVGGSTTRQHSWELFGFNTGVNETGLSVNNTSIHRTRGYRFYENNISSAKIAPFANTIAGGVDGGGGSTGYNNNGTSSAADGDMDIIYSLIAADKQWGSSGRFDYRQIALDMLEGFWRSVVNPHYNTIMFGDWSFAGARPDNARTRPSDFMLGHLRAFKAFDTARNWQLVIDATLNVIANIRDSQHVIENPNNGLLPDFTIRDNDTGKWIVPTVRVLESADNDGQYGWNSVRTPWRLGTAYLHYGDMAMTGSLSNPSLFTYSIKPLDDFAKARVGNDRNTMRGLSMIYPINSPLANSTLGATPSFVVPFVVTAAAVRNDQNWVDAFWTWSNTFHFENNWYADYYKLIALITASGNFWKPEAMN